MFSMDNIMYDIIQTTSKPLPGKKEELTALITEIPFKLVADINYIYDLISLCLDFFLSVCQNM